MLAKVRSCAVVGLEGAPVEVEVDIARGLPRFNVVGLPDAAVQEARERVRSAVRNSGGEFPRTRLTVNLAPADLRKAGPAYDLPIALGVLLASGQIEADLSDTLVIGELSLDGSLRHTQGILPMVSLGQELGFKRVIVPAQNASEAALVEGVDVLPAESLSRLASHYRGDDPITLTLPTERPEPEIEDAAGHVDFADIRGQEHAKRALEIAAAGGHNVILSGPPGSGKTLLSRAMPGILPALSRAEALEVTKIYSVAGQLPTNEPLVSVRPFRSPHYTISNAGLVGGGRWPRPGEISLCHRGVLFLDELPEFGQATLEVLRQPMEDKIVTISRAQGATTFPAGFMLLGAMNPCPCGYYGDPGKECVCTAGAVARYQKRISGPLLDRIDLFVQAPRVEYEKLMDRERAESSASVRRRVERARERQRARCEGERFACNADMDVTETRKHCVLDDAGEALLQTAMERFQMSARAFNRTLKLSRTIADLAGEADITAAYVAEALQYRSRGLG